VDLGKDGTKSEEREASSQPLWPTSPSRSGRYVPSGEPTQKTIADRARKRTVALRTRRNSPDPAPKIWGRRRLDVAQVWIALPQRRGLVTGDVESLAVASFAGGPVLAGDQGSLQGSRRDIFDVGLRRPGV
jgi:hypothetical protein